MISDLAGASLDNPDSSVLLLSLVRLVKLLPPPQKDEFFASLHTAS